MELNELRIGPITYQVTFVGSDQLEYLKEDEKEEAPSGESRPDECRMVINRDHHPQQQAVALFHEIFHVLLAQAGKFYESGDEELVSVLAHGMAQVLRDNQQLTRLAQEWPVDYD